MSHLENLQKFCVYVKCRNDMFLQICMFIYIWIYIVFYETSYNSIRYWSMWPYFHIIRKLLQVDYFILYVYKCKLCRNREKLGRENAVLKNSLIFLTDNLQLTICRPAGSKWYQIVPADYCKLQRIAAFRNSQGFKEAAQELFLCNYCRSRKKTKIKQK